MKLADYEAVSQASTREEFLAALSTFAGKMGFPLINALLVDGTQESVNLQIASIGNAPTEFLATHADLSRMRKDPVMHRLMGEPTPFFWDQAFYVRAGMGHVWEDQAPHGYRVGVATSLPVGDGQRLLIGVDRHDDLPSNVEHLTRLQADLQLLAAHAHVAARRLLRKPVQTSLDVLQLPNLSPREIDVLRWTREGKTAEVVGQILGIKERTVNSYIQSAMEKLGVVGSKHKAVLLATTLGLI